MRTIILAAGEGNRIRPYTADQPKCMVPLGGRPLLHWQLDCLKVCKVVGPIIVVGGYRIDRLVAPGATVLQNHAYARTNMVATLFCARSHMIPGEDLLISYGDIVYEPRVLRALLNTESPLSLAADREWRRFWTLRMDDPLVDAETFKIDQSGYVQELGKKPESYADIEAQYIGLIRVSGKHVGAFLEHYDKLDRSAFYDGKDFDNMYMTSLLQNLIESGWQVKACLVNNGWLEVDTAQELEKYQHMYNEGSLSRFCDLGTILSGISS